MKGLYLNLVVTKKGMLHSSQMLTYLYGIHTKLKKLISILPKHFDHCVFNGVSI